MSENQIPSEYLDVGKNSPEKRTSQPEETATEANEREVTAGDIQLKIYFGGHDTEEDADKLAKGLQEADVYIPEVNGWNDSALKFFSDVSKGEQSLDTIIKDAERSGAVIGPFRRRVSDTATKPYRMPPKK